MSLRLKLLALGLATLGLPWAGCRYAREMEAALREGEQTSLQAVAQTIVRRGESGVPIRAVMLERLGPNVWHDTPAAAMATLEELEETARL